ncbi:MAG: tRNA (adenosine(37)-N6)-threonylcarbamoyltransferase complex transferase subunit TsaD, partial [bacterium]
GALASGVAVAKTIAKILNKPVIPVNHLWGHLLVNFKSIEQNYANKKYLGLVISGGHTNTYILESLIPLKIRKLSSTLDDAVGEAFDKAARVLNLGFPGGPIIDKLAQNYQQKNPEKIKEIRPIFPVPNPSDYNFSYSGLKTALIRYIKKNPDFDVEEICFHFQYSAIKHIINKLELILREIKVDWILVGGGVAANSFLRNELAKIQDKYGVEILIPEPVLCTDNAAMIAIASIFIHLSYPNIPEDFDIYPNEEEGLLENYIIDTPNKI